MFGDDIHNVFDSIPKEYGYVVLVPGYIISLSPVPPKFPIDGIATLVLPVVDKLLNIPVVQFKVPFIVPPVVVIVPVADILPVTLTPDVFIEKYSVSLTGSL